MNFDALYGSHVFAARIPCLLRIIVWGSILLTFVVLTVGAYVVLEKANRKRESETPAEQDSLTEVRLLIVSHFVVC